jgi:poly(3-hydroxybutyrate) depolymerase
MRRAVAAALFCACAGVASAANFRKELLEHDGTSRTYYLSAPKDLAAGEKCPLVLAFHGTGGEGAKIVDNWAKLAQKERFFVAGLKSLDRWNWTMPADGPDLVHEMTETLLRKLPIDSSRIYLSGHSAGAVFALRLGLLESQYFAAVAVHAGSFRSSADFATVRMARRKLPVLIISGDLDPYFPLASVKSTVAAMQAAGIPAESFIMNGDHRYYALGDSVNVRAWEFLKKQSLKATPRYEVYANPDRSPIGINRGPWPPP